MSGGDSVHDAGRELSPGPDLVSTRAIENRAPDAGHRPKVRPAHPPSGSRTKSHASSGAEPSGSRLLNLKAAANYLGVSPWTIRDLEAKRVLKRVTVPLPGGTELRKLLFDKVELDRLIDVWRS